MKVKELHHLLSLMPQNATVVFNGATGEIPLNFIINNKDGIIKLSELSEEQRHRNEELTKIKNKINSLRRDAIENILKSVSLLIMGLFLLLNIPVATLLTPMAWLLTSNTFIGFVMILAIIAFGQTGYKNIKEMRSLKDETNNLN
jgi:hypothetical protein